VVIWFIVFSCSGLLSCIKLCICVCRLVLFVSTLGNLFAWKTDSCDMFRLEGFSPIGYKEQIEKLFIACITNT